MGNEAIDIQAARDADYKRGQHIALKHYQEEGCCNRNKFQKGSDAWQGYELIASQKLREDSFSQGV